MEFESKAHEETYEKVKTYVRELFGEMARVRPEKPIFIMPVGSTLNHIAILPWGDDDAVVCIRAYVVTGADLNEDLLMFLLRKNDSMRFGAFGVDRDGDIFFEHTIVGSTLDKEKLRASTLAVGTTADRYDEEIVGRWGGMRALDHAKD